MLDQIINIAKQQLSGNLKQNANLNDKQVNDTFSTAKDSMFEGLKDKATSPGGLSDLFNLYNGKASPSVAESLTRTVVSKFVPMISQRVGIPNDKAVMVANMVVPFIISKFADKSTGTANSEKDMLSSFGMGNLGSMGGMLGNLGENLGGLFK